MLLPLTCLLIMRRYSLGRERAGSVFVALFRLHCSPNSTLQQSSMVEKANVGHNHQVCSKELGGEWVLTYRTVSS